MDMPACLPHTAPRARTQSGALLNALRLALAPVVFALALTACAASPPRFDSAAWKAQRGMPEEKNQRNSMVVAARDQLRVGMTRAEVIALLGEPDSVRQGGSMEVYAVGASPLGIDSQYLELTYRDGRLVSFAISEA